MEILITVDNSDEFLAHHGVKGMKWGVWNAETAARRLGNAVQNFMGGGGDNEDEDDDSPETLLKRGLLDEKSANAMRNSLDRLIERSENGLINESEYAKAVNTIYERYNLPKPNDAAALRKAEARDNLKTQGINPYAETKASAQAKMVANARANAKNFLEARKSLAENGNSPSNLLEAINNKVKGTSQDAKDVADAYMTQRRARQINTIANKPDKIASVQEHRTENARRGAAVQERKDRNIFNRAAKAIKEASMSNREKIQRDGLSAVTKIVKNESKSHPVANAATKIKNTSNANTVKGLTQKVKDEQAKHPIANAATKVKQTSGKNSLNKAQQAVRSEPAKHPVNQAAKRVEEQAKGVTKQTENIGWDPKTRKYKAKKVTYTTKDGRTMTRVINN